MRRASAGLLAAAIVAIGLIGSYSYWENYYVTRGFAAPKRLSGSKPGRLFKVRFFSPALGRQSDYMVYLPAGYSRTDRLPVFYLLHGIPGRPISYSVIGHIEVRLDNLISRRRAPRMILVFPDGRIDGSTFSDSEWANTPSGQFETYVVDVVHDVDHRFATRSDRASRVIGGLSAGAYGALNIALHHLALFGSVQAWSGYFTQTRTGVFAGASRAELAYDSPFLYVRKLKRELARFPLNAFLLSGRGDQGTRRQVGSMAGALKAEGAHVNWALYRGGHDWALWNSHLDGMLVLAGTDVTRPLHVPIRFRGRRAHRGPPHTRLHPHGAPARVPVAVGLSIKSRTPVAVAGGEGAGGVLGGLLLALLSATAINIGFLLQHRGLRSLGATRGVAGMVGAAIRNPTWLGGQALGWAGFATQIVAVSIAPLSLVQAFAAGGLALSVPLAAGLFGYTISRTQRNTVLLVAAALATLPIGISSPADVLDAGRLVVVITLLGAVAFPVARSQSPALKAIAAGLLYGVADASIKAVSVNWSAHGSSALISGWTLVAILATLGAFLSFQLALRTGSAVSAISLSTALCALVGVGCSLFAFGETLGTGPVAVAWHLAAIAVVLGCVPMLAAAQAEIEDASDRTQSGGDPARPLGSRLRTAVGVPARPHERTAGGK